MAILDRSIAQLATSFQKLARARTTDNAQRVTPHSTHSTASSILRLSMCSGRSGNAQRSLPLTSDYFAIPSHHKLHILPNSSRSHIARHQSKDRPTISTGTYTARAKHHGNQTQSTNKHASYITSAQLLIARQPSTALCCVMRAGCASGGLVRSVQAARMLPWAGGSRCRPTSRSC